MVVEGGGGGWRAARTLSLGMWHPVRSHKDLSPCSLITEGPWDKEASRSALILDRSQTLHMHANAWVVQFML